MERDSGQRYERDRGTGSAAHIVRDEGYRAGGRIHDGQGRRTRLVVLALVAVVGLGVLLAALRNDSSSLAPLLGDLAPTMTAAPAVSDVLPGPTPLPRLGILGAPLPERPIPMMAGWLRWLDPRTGELGGDAQPPDLAHPAFTFADTNGNVVQVCGSTSEAGGALTVQIDVCSFDPDGHQVAERPVVILHPAAVIQYDSQFVQTPFELDATVSRDGQWLWIASSVRTAGGWDEALHRVRLSPLEAAGSRVVRTIPVATAEAGPRSAEGWLVAATSTIRPVVRASPDGSRVFVTMTELPGFGAPIGLLQQERIEVDASVGHTDPINVVFAAGAASDVACDPSRSAWATDNHYISICWHEDSSGNIEPFVRIENPFDMTRDVGVGPTIPSADQTTDDSAWLLNADRGVLYRWSYLHHTLSTFDVNSRAGSTLTFDFDGPASVPGIWPEPVPVSPRWAWSSLDGGSVPGWDSLRLAGSADGTVLYALGLGPVSRDGLTRLGPEVWAIDAGTGRPIDRWDTPGPVDQLALAPLGGPLVELATPRLPQSSLQNRGPVVDWTTQVWFQDRRTGAPLEVLGELRGPGYAIPVLLPPAMGFVGF